ncbi:MAG TPA: 3,4-dihydroxy-2-butanone-4-phosphate synthase [Candidatus Thermoplasmatota archaeon]|nr:3,4-dihydroxy-2-butanone-4-phosphate synthase [Candidatus Thermoplasmatota archaeon]
MTLAPALAALREGRFVAVYDFDGREEETDLFIAAEHATPEAVRRLRRDAGGLVFMAVDDPIAGRFGLPFLQDVFAEAAERHPVIAGLVPNDIRYDTRSSFSLTLNHRRTFTGITDDDRSLTASRFAGLARETAGIPPVDAQRRLGAEFRAPGHVFLCVGSKRPLETRRGHTELGVALARMAGVTPVLLGAEMLGRGRALSKSEAGEYARAEGIPHVDGEQVLRAWDSFKAAQGVRATAVTS